MLVLIVVLVAVLVMLTVAVAGVSVRRRARSGTVEFAAPETLEEAAPGQEEAPSPALEAPTHEDALAEDALAEDALAEDALLEEAPPAARPRLAHRLSKARGFLGGRVAAVLARSGIDNDTWDELEEALIGADVGVSTTLALLEGLRDRVKVGEIRDPAGLLDALKSDVIDRLACGDRTLTIGREGPTVWLFVGVNGVGKTTTIGKVGLREGGFGRSVVMAAADTFRAAAADQLDLWARRVGADLVKGSEGGDPGSVVFDAVQRAAARGSDVVLADTAGRLHTKVNLMEELKKVRRVAERAPGSLGEVLLVIDATTGQNGLAQARQFAEAVGVTGVVLTKLDGTAKGGIVVAIQADLGIPVKLVGLGESAVDLVELEPREFVEALFSES